MKGEKGIFCFMHPFLHIENVVLRLKFLTTTDISHFSSKIAPMVDSLKNFVSKISLFKFILHRTLGIQ